MLGLLGAMYSLLRTLGFLLTLGLLKSVGFFKPGYWFLFGCLLRRVSLGGNVTRLRGFLLRYVTYRLPGQTIFMY